MRHLSPCDHLPKPTPDGQTRLTRTPLEFISRLAALIPAPRLHRHRDSGVVAPNARLRPAVTALACEAGASGEAGIPASPDDDQETGCRSPARYLCSITGGHSIIGGHSITEGQVVQRSMLYRKAVGSRVVRAARSLKLTFGRCCRALAAYQRVYTAS
jgi:hypothetical protein